MFGNSSRLSTANAAFSGFRITTETANQACLGGGYWKKKKIRKHRKLKKKKRTSFQSEERKEKLLDFNILQANVCGLDKKKTQLAKIMEERNVHI